MKNMKKAKVIIGIILLFAAGALTGSLLTGLHMKNRFEAFARGGGPPKGRILKRLSSELDLTAAQKSEIEKILEVSHAQLSEIRKKAHPQFQKIIEATHEQIREKLDEKQQRKLDEIYEKLKKRFQNRGFHPKPGGGGPP